MTPSSLSSRSESGFGGDLGERSCGKSERVGVCALTLPEVWHVRVSAHTAVLYALLICFLPLVLVVKVKGVVKLGEMSSMMVEGSCLMSPY